MTTPTQPAAPLLLCLLPAERAALASAVVQAGGVPVIDLTCADAALVPAGAWVRVRPGQAAPGTGPVLVAGAGPAPGGRECWIELTEVRPTPAGFAGIVLRGEEAGGPCGALPGLDLLATVPADQAVILDAGLLPEDAAAAAAAGVAGVVLSDVLLALPELVLPAPLRQRLDRADLSTTHVLNGLRVEASPLAPVLRRLLAGEPYWDLARGWFTAADPAQVAWPAGAALREAAGLASRVGSLHGLLSAYRAAIAAGSDAAVLRPPPLAAQGAAAAPVAPAPPADKAVAIVGMGCRLPLGNSVEQFWEGVKAGRSAIGEVPPARWDPALYWDEDPQAEDKSYAKIGAFLTDFVFDPRRFRIPPKVAQSVDPVQQIALESVADALEDAGYRAVPRGPGKEFDRERCAVILGNSMGGELENDTTLRVRTPLLREALAHTPGFSDLPAHQQQALLDAFEARLKADLPPITEDSMPGELANVIAGRIANAFDLGGPNFTVDAACASSMAAIQTAVKGLLDGDYDMVVTGGVDRSMDVATYVKFCKIGALSPDRSTPFDDGANGFVMGEGCGILVLKRLDLAERDGDRIYAVVRGVGASSDGKGKGITAPNPTGQRLALRRAYEDAGVDPAEVDLVECHGTSTVVGDKVEVECLSEVVGAGRRGPRGPIRIGSVKSNIGHLKSAAGAASIIKVAKAIHEGVLPPSAGFARPRADVPFDVVPLQVQTRLEPWPEGRVRRAGVSAFGFGGTNFHVVLEQHRPQAQRRADEAPRREEPLPAPADLPAGVWAASADDRAELVATLERGEVSRGFDPSAPVRVAAAAEDQAEQRDQLARAAEMLGKGKDPSLLRGRGIYVEEAPADGKLAFLFTGQGSQYLDMGLDLAAHYPVVAETFRVADEIMAPVLGRPLTDFIRRDPAMDEDAQFDALRATEISQPATLTVDVAILRVLAAYGVLPDMVAGHSLGEYAAAVAAGMLSFEDALRAVSARGREMASIKLADPGRMAGIATGVETVNEVLAEVPGYVVAANKNCPTQTVIAGESDAVEAAIESFRSRNITVYEIPVSHAFHSRIVAPASEPLRGVLGKLDLREPRRPITTNVTSRYYPTGPGARDVILDTLAAQVASPVEWTAQVERMYADGARIFVECGPKRALTGFVVSILKRRPHRALYTNHPKRGGVHSVHDALAGLLSLGFPVRSQPLPGVPDLFAEPEPRRATTAAIAARMQRGGAAPSQVEPTTGVARTVLEMVAEATGYAITDLSMEDELEADLGVDSIKQAELVAAVRDRFKLDHDPHFRIRDHRSLRDLANYVARKLGATRPVLRRALPLPAAPVAPVAPVSAAPRAAAPALHGAALPADVLSALAEGAVRAGLAGGDADAVARAVLPAMQSLVAALVAALPAPVAPAAAVVPTSPVAAAATPRTVSAPAAPAAVDIVCSGASLGLPGGDEVFSPGNVAAILGGENRISRLDEQVQDRFVAKHIVRLQKDPRTGRGDFVMVSEREQVIRLAGVGGHLDVVGDYGIDPDLARALDATTKLAFAAGIEALHDAGIPLVRTWRETTTGRRVATGWALPEELRDDTGIVFASAFPGYSQLIQHLQTGGDDGEGHFDRRFLFQVLAMGHSQFAQLIGARGPNTQVNAACASTTQAISIAADWLRTGRARRVIVVGADDVTNDQLMEWIGAGFMAAGAATTQDRVEEAALPFDQRRHGLILGMGAVGLVLERGEDVAARGMVPVARLLADRLANSAFHGTRLDPEHIAREMDALVAEACAQLGLDRQSLARQALFMSHETYTPAKGGSAAAEIASLRRAFGDGARQVVITNTKGFTGHPMGAGIEDAIAVKALQYGRVPPLPNLRQPDPELGDLTLSRGGSFTGRYAIRLAAGFGSQLALTAWEKMAEGDLRIVDQPAYSAWLARAGGVRAPHLVVEDRTLRLVDLSPAEERAAPPESAAAPTVMAPPQLIEETDSIPGLTSLGEAANAEAALSELVEVLAEKTGYDKSEIDPDYELEADLGIDTVKQAEVFAEVRERHGLERDDGFRLSDYRTVRALAGWLAERIGAVQGGITGLPDDEPVMPRPARALPDGPGTAAFLEAVDAVEPPARGAVAAVDPEQTLRELVEVLAEKTGYEPDEIDPDYELEADLGIDTVKQAEVFAEVRERHGLERDDDFRLSDYRTVRALAGWLAGALAARDSGGEGTDSVPTGASVEAIISRVPDLASVHEVPEPAGLRAASSPAAGDASASGSSSGSGLSSGAVPTEELPPETLPGEALDSVIANLVAAPDRTLPPAFRIRRPVLVEREPWAVGSLRGRSVRVLGSGGLAQAIRDEVLARGGRVSGPPDAVIDASEDVRLAFQAAQELATSGDALPRDWVCLTRLGQQPDSASLDRALAQGARAGLAKAIGREWEGCDARVVDLDPGLDDSAAAMLCCGELAAGDGAVEIFRSVDARRTVELQREPFPTQGGTLPGQPLIVLTGGTRGITAMCALALARRGPVRLALLARSGPGEQPLDEAAEKARIKARLQAQGERATPAQVERELAPLRRAEEARRNLVALRALGADARFFRVDLADPAAVALALDQVRDSFDSPIDGCIHGAGVEESRPLAEKDLDAFARVYDGKALGGLVLAEHLEPDAWLVSMGSVAGRFGNPGQVDYAAANEAMARVCLARPRSLHVSWTAWGDVGMAVRGGMERLLTERGVELLPAGAGAELLVDMVAAGMVGEVVVAGRLGDMTLRPTHALLDAVELVGDGVVARRRLAMETDAWIDDHSIEDTPVLPGVIGLEMMAATALLTRPGSRYAGARDVVFDRAVKLHRGEPVDLVVRADPQPDGSVSCTLSTERVLRTGRAQVVDAFRATVLLDQPLETEPLPPAFFTEEGINRGAIYKRFFHGPAFQVLRDAGAVATQNLLADAMVEHAFIAGGLVSMPLVLEAAFQAAGLHRMALHGAMALPASIEQVALVRTIRDGEPLNVMVRELDGGQAYDVDVDGPDGAVLRVRGFRMVETGPLHDGDRFPVPEGGWPRTVFARATGTKVRTLTDAERASVASRGTARRRLDRLAGQEAARLAVVGFTGWALAAFEIGRMDSGRPFVDGPGPVEVSITHSEGEGLAVAGTGGLLGVDRERVEARGRAFASTWLTLGEARLCDGDPRRETAIWAAKEAVLKALGAGMALDPRAVEVEALSWRRARIRLHGEAAAAAASLGGRLTVSLGHEAEHVVACALLAGGRWPDRAARGVG